MTSQRSLERTFATVSVRRQRLWESPHKRIVDVLDRRVFRWNDNATDVVCRLQSVSKSLPPGIEECRPLLSRLVLHDLRLLKVG